MTEAEKIKETCKLLGLSPRALANSMNVAPNTVYRWIAGTSTPKGLSAQVLAALHQSATTLAERKDGAHLAKLAGAKVSLGIGALLFYGLKDLRRS